MKRMKMVKMVKMVKIMSKNKSSRGDVQVDEWDRSPGKQESNKCI